MRARILAVVVAVAVAACGGSADHPPDGGLDASAASDAARDVDPDGPRVWCNDSTLDGGGMLCAPGMICGNSGGVPGNFCCYPQAGMPSDACPP